MFAKNEPKPDTEIFTVYDSVTESYRLPTYAINKYDILRQLENFFKTPEQAKHEFVTNSEHFSLFKIGTFDRKTGKLTVQSPEHVANLHEIRASLQKNQDRALSPT